MALHMNLTSVETTELKSNMKMVRNGHAKPKSVAQLQLNRPGRVRVGHLLTLLDIFHSTLYERIKRGTWPAPDGKDILRSEQVQPLGDIVKELHRAKLIGKNAVSTRLFKKFPDRFELSPEPQPNQVRYVAN